MVSDDAFGVLVGLGTGVEWLGVFFGVVGGSSLWFEPPIEEKDNTANFPVFSKFKCEDIVEFRCENLSSTTHY